MLVQWDKQVKIKIVEDEKTKGKRRKLQRKRRGGYDVQGKE
jgi:hypothetical protein